MSDIPTAAALEPVWMLEMTYAPDAAETRVPFRARHLARLLELMDAGVVVEAGAYADVSSSLVLVRAVDEEAALDIARADIYMANGVWVEARARKFGRVVRPGVAGT